MRPSSTAATLTEVRLAAAGRASAADMPVESCVLALQAASLPALPADGVGDYALCNQIDSCLEDGILLSQILAPMTQVNGIKSGWLFDPDTMEPLVDNEVRAAQRLGIPALVAHTADAGVAMLL